MSDDAETETGSLDLIWGVKDLASFLEVDERRIQQLAKDGIMIKIGRGKYDALSSIKGYVDMLRDGGSLDVIDTKEALEMEKLRWTAAKADSEEVKLALLRGEVVLMEDACELLAEEGGSVRAAVEGAIPEITEELANVARPHAEVHLVLHEALSRALSKLTLDQPDGRKPKSNQLPPYLTGDDEDAGSFEDDHSS
ncbi:hypothetical protein [Sulfitobacter dubius]|uniref:hypothetical protein n=1 Tax=Sulfitobacter dubius TaxID=218673 RepID=UPI0022AF066C|nr:hypothetical protein [Sulfitobacter dubius]MCZ4366630.1 hypothetical protein [Sulfitobacter dubius]